MLTDVIDIGKSEYLAFILSHHWFVVILYIFFNVFACHL